MLGNSNFDQGDKKDSCKLFCESTVKIQTRLFFDPTAENFATRLFPNERIENGEMHIYVTPGHIIYSLHPYYVHPLSHKQPNTMRVPVAYILRYVKWPRFFSRLTVCGKRGRPLPSYTQYCDWNNDNFISIHRPIDSVLVNLCVALPLAS